MTGSVVRIKGLQRFINKHSGREYCYHRASGTRLQSPFGSPEFFAELAAVEAAHKAKTKRDALPRTLGEAIDAYTSSHKFRHELAARTRKDYFTVLTDLDGIRDMPLAAIDRPFIARLRDRHAAEHSWHRANYLLQVMAQVLKAPVEYGALKENPTIGITKLARPRDLPAANRPWTEEERTIVLDAATPHLRLPLAIGALTGLRIADIIRLPRTVFHEDITPYMTRKRGVEVFLLRTEAVRREIMRAPAHNAITLCANSRGHPWTEDGLRCNFTKLRTALESDGKIGAGLTIHGLRHTVASELAECGVTDAEIAIWLGQKTTAMARHYSERADKRKRVNNVVVKLKKQGKL